MERGLLWLPLLGVFIGLAWVGWREYQKVATYELWAKDFERAKYDVYAVIGQRGAELTWGRPALGAPVGLQTFSLLVVQDIQLLVNGQPVATDDPPGSGKSVLEFAFNDGRSPAQIPFTDPQLAAKWAIALREVRQALILEH
ncbi:MAG: hypothetical protein HC838_07895 [Spirulinaceae cyanobacterium RM2_2_10]|nr:hypothetical protein [bacterium]NJO19988.1 hypothetical protein [Spirulinaceae cyanobacterium RM2_2_10]